MARIITVVVYLEFAFFLFTSGKDRHYLKSANIKCQSQIDIGNYSDIECAIMCMNHRAMAGLPCMAFNVSNSVCTLCLSGPVSRIKQVIWSSTEEVYAATVRNFEEELEKGEKYALRTERQGRVDWGPPRAMQKRKNFCNSFGAPSRNVPIFKKTCVLKFRSIWIKLEVATEL